MADCPFCDRISDAQMDDIAIAFEDAFPLAPGHMLVIPRRHVSRIEDLDPGEWRAVFDRVRAAVIDARSGADVAGVNIGVNSGAAAGQTVDHAHVHVIPRRQGDVGDPRGGVRWVIPDRAAYWGSP